MSMPTGTLGLVPAVTGPGPPSGNPTRCGLVTTNTTIASMGGAVTMAAPPCSHVCRVSYPQGLKSWMEVRVCP